MQDENLQISTLYKAESAKKNLRWVEIKKKNCKMSQNIQRLPDNKALSTFAELVLFFIDIFVDLVDGSFLL